MKKITPTLVFVILSILLISCINTDNHFEPYVKDVESKKTILILPLNKGVSEKYLTSSLDMLKKSFPDVDIVIGEPVKLPNTCLNYNKSRYRADSILLFLDEIKPDSIDKVIGLTSSDISVTRTLTVNGNKITHPDRGIFGLGRLHGSVCVVSNYRTDNIETFSKTTVHEFMHTLGVPHCEHERCIMQDGKGSGKNMGESTHIHKDCYELALKGF
jgi:archaemetzincin